MGRQSRGKRGGSAGGGRMAVLVACTLASGCGDAAPAAVPSQVWDSAGVRIVEVPAERLTLPAPIHVDSVAHLRVGTVDGPETTTLSSPVAAERLSDGRIFLVESGAQRPRLLAANGAFLSWIGQVGEGPAEFSRVSGGGVWRGDTLWVHDGARRRVVLFGPDGAFHRGFGYGEPSGTTNVRFVRTLQDGRLAHVASTLGAEAALQSGGEFTERVLLHLLDGDGQNPRQVLDGAGSTYEVTSTETSSGQRAVMIRTDDPLFSPAFRVEVDREGHAWAGNGEAFELRRLLPTGELTEVFRAPAQAERMTAARFEEYVERSVERSPPQVQEGQAAFLREREYAELLPAFERLMVDVRGLLWVSEYTQHRPGEHPSLWWVLEPGGDLLGRVRLPEGFHLLRIGEDEVLGVERDELDVPYLVGYRLERG
jgi:hypothetical protein